MFVRPKIRRSGFTLVELMVVIAIIGILVALLLPAVQAAREAARRTHCNNNIKQLALALQNFHDVHHIYPPSVQFDYGQDPANSDNYRPNWVILILPFMDEQNTHDQFDFSQKISHPNNRRARGMTISTMLCPSDTNQNVLFAGQMGTGEGDNWARGNYAANGANAYLDDGGAPNVHCGQNGQAASQAPGWIDLDRRGVMGACVSVSIPKILDGTSHVLLLSEVRVGVNQYDRRGTWAMGTAGSSALFAHGFGGDDNGPNASNDWADDIRGCDYLRNTDPGVPALLNDGMSCWPGPSDQATARGRHPGGVVAAFCDGSVHFIAETIYTSGAWGGSAGVWDRLITCCDGAVVTPGDFGIIE